MIKQAGQQYTSVQSLFFFQLNRQPVRIGKSDLNAGEKNNHHPGYDDPDEGIGIDHANTNIAGKTQNLRLLPGYSLLLKQGGNDQAGFMTGPVQVVIYDDVVEMTSE